ncbi:DsrE family protein [Roseibacterium sp. SDUM158016]|jgi:intracellular sulfur oxidation DsrE/DsrF family protein|uniref:DsrE family protein n=1 Tax=Roseicyclus sediminis TaxID=2980997 RepID=UPI0021D1866A|nr:DsrE family protein [Roseibacterium sp. SDUM158016]MCU4653176.1 DsrE family protein [Roseibacterium sp. SDUM158016]
MKHLFAATAVALVTATGAWAEGVTHYVAIQVNSNEPQTMNMALNNAVNVTRHYEAQGDTVEIEIVAYGPGLTMFIPDRSPVEDRINSMSLEYANMSFSACGNTHANWSQREGAEVPLLENVSITPSGVVRLMELQEQGYAYIRP